MEPLLIEIECHAGYKADETPRRFRFEQNWIEVEEVGDKSISQNLLSPSDEKPPTGIQVMLQKIEPSVAGLAMLIALNQYFAGRLDEVSRILAEQGTNRFRVQAYRQAASSALFSNTARVHELNKKQDWLVLYYDGPAGERQCTSEFGQIQGERIVRGRDQGCREHYQSLKRTAPCSAGA